MRGEPVNRKNDRPHHIQVAGKLPIGDGRGLPTLSMRTTAKKWRNDCDDR